MNKLVIFDLDGVLIDSRNMHYDALNRALAKVDEKYVITREEHLSAYDGLPTTKKLEHNYKYLENIANTATKQLQQNQKTTRKKLQATRKHRKNIKTTPQKLQKQQKLLQKVRLKVKASYYQ